MYPSYVLVAVMESEFVIQHFKCIVFSTVGHEGFKNAKLNLSATS